MIFYRSFGYGDKEKHQYYLSQIAVIQVNISCKLVTLHYQYFEYFIIVISLKVLTFSFNSPYLILAKTLFLQAQTIPTSAIAGEHNTFKEYPTIHSFPIDIFLPLITNIKVCKSGGNVRISA